MDFIILILVDEYIIVILPKRYVFYLKSLFIDKNL